MGECIVIDLRNGDCIHEMKSMPENSVDCIITSPPYNFDMNYGQYDDDISWGKYFAWLKDVFCECFRVLKDDGRLIVNIQPLFSDYIPTHHIISQKIMEIGFKWKAEILWEKNNYNCKYCSWGSWKSPSSPYLKYTWEFVEVYVKKEYKHHGKKENIDITDDEFKKFVIAKWSIAPERKMKKFDHPAMFPEELPFRCLRLFTYKGDVVLDPFMGAGTTGVVCKKIGRNFIGIEIDKKHFETAEKRIKETSSQMTLSDLLYGGENGKA